jgi:hypothetical protein
VFIPRAAPGKGSTSFHPLKTALARPGSQVLLANIGTIA